MAGDLTAGLVNGDVTGDLVDNSGALVGGVTNTGDLTGIAGGLVNGGFLSDITGNSVDLAGIAGGLVFIAVFLVAVRLLRISEFGVLNPLLRRLRLPQIG